MQSPKIKIVPDTGFYVAAALKDGYARTYLVGKGSKYLSYQLYSSESILLEVQSKLENKFGFNRPMVVNALNDIRKIVIIVHPKEKINAVRDPDDDKIIECALEAKAEVIVSFDKDLLMMKTYKDIKMVHPASLKYWFVEK